MKIIKNNDNAYCATIENAKAIFKYLSTNSY